MIITRRETLSLLSATAALTATSTVFASSATAQDATAPVTHEVVMLNKASDDPKKIMVFEPDLIRANIGDIVKFIPTDRGHSVNSMKDLIPAGAEELKSGINDEIEYKLTVEGAYAIQCTPHMAMGMVMLVLVGDVASNFETVKAERYRGEAKERFADIFVRADALLMTESTSG